MRENLLRRFGEALTTGARTILTPAVAKRQSPADAAAKSDMTAEEQKHSAALMRVNHCGEVCARYIRGRHYLPAIARLPKRCKKRRTKRLTIWRGHHRALPNSAGA